MGLEEQTEEREVLQSIFPEELTEISDTEFRISVTLDVPGDKDDPPPSMLLNVRYPPEYPDRAPYLDLLAAPSSAPHPNFSVADDREWLLEGLAATVEENLGMAMVFTLVTTLKEAAEQLVVGRREAAERVREEAALAVEREENRKFEGQKVTPEVFMRWREGLLKEMAEVRAREEDQRAAEAKRAKAKEVPKLTGKQLWQMGLAGKEADEVDDDEVDDGGPAGEMDRLKLAA